MAQRDVEPKEENAAELEFGKDLINCECLSTSEVAEFFAKCEPEPQEKRCAARVCGSRWHARPTRGLPRPQ